jgi:hypothetical protein
MRRVQASSAQKTFTQHGYAILKDLITGPVRGFLYEYAVKSAKAGRLAHPDETFPNTPCAYGDPLMDSLMEQLRPQIERATSRKLHPTYSYLRVYQRGDILKRHTDRPSCEISVTLNLGYKAPNPWPIWIERDGKPLDVTLLAGDGLIYRGIDSPHWRKRFDGDYAAQVFLHYVDREGANQEWIYDKRDALTMTPFFRKLLRKLATSS